MKQKSSLNFYIKIYLEKMKIYQFILELLIDYPSV